MCVCERERARNIGRSIRISTKKFLTHTFFVNITFYNRLLLYLNTIYVIVLTERI